MMRALLGDYFARSPVLIVPLVGMLMLFAVFILSSWRVWRARSEQVDGLARLPLEEDEARGKP